MKTSICDDGIAVHSVQLGSSSRLLLQDAYVSESLYVWMNQSTLGVVCVFLFWGFSFFEGGGVREGRFISLLFINSTNSIRATRQNSSPLSRARHNVKAQVWKRKQLARTCACREYALRYKRDDPMRVESVPFRCVCVFCNAELKRRWLAVGVSSHSIFFSAKLNHLSENQGGWLRIHRARGHTEGNISCGGNWAIVTKKLGVRNWHDDVRRRNQAASLRLLFLLLLFLVVVYPNALGAHRLSLHRVEGLSGNRILAIL